MNRIAIVLAVTLTASALAADLPTLTSSQAALTGALEGVLKDPLEVVHHIPGYGYHFAARATFEELDVAETIDTVVNLLVTLAPTMRGLDPGDWLSVFYRGRVGFTAKYDLVVRVRWDDTSIVEVWRDGVQLR